MGRSKENTYMKTHTLTLQRQEFIRQLFSPEVMFNASEAYRRAYPKAKGGHNRLANQLMSSNVIKKEIARFRAELAKKTGFCLDDAQRLYEEDRLFARSINQAGPAVSATTGICRLYGFDKDNAVGEKTIIVIAPKVSTTKQLPKQVESEVKDV